MATFPLDRNPNVAPGILSREGAAFVEARRMGPSSLRPPAPAPAVAPAPVAQAGPAARSSVLRGAHAYGTGNASYFGPQAQSRAPQGAWNKVTSPIATVRSALPSGPTLRSVASGSGRMGAAGALIDTALDTGRVAADALKGGRSTGIDVAEQAATGAAKGASGILGAQLGATAGAFAGPAAPVVSPLLAIGGGIAGYYGGDKAIRGIKSAFGLDTATPVERMDAPAPAPVAAPAPTLRASDGRVDLQALSPGVKPSDAGSGPGQGARGGAAYAAVDPRRLDIDPADPRLGASRDFTKELSATPKTLPPDLRPGVIHKTVDPATGQPTYSGADVKAGAMMVDGRGRTLREGGSTTFLEGGRSGGGYMPAAAPSGFDRGTAGGVGNMSAGFSERLRDQNDLTAASSITLRPEERMAMREDVAQRQQLRLKEEGENGRAQINANVSLRNNERNANVAMRGQDLELQGRLLPAQQKMLYDQRIAAAKGQLLQQANGDYRAAALLADKLGLPFGDDFRKAVSENQAVASGRVKAARDAFEGQVIGADGKPDKAAEAAAFQLAQRETGGAFGDADVAQQSAEMPERLRRAALLQSANANRNTMPWHNNPEISNLPTDEQLAGAEYDRVGFFRGMIPWDNIKWGDHRLRMSDPKGGAREMVFGRDIITEGDLKKTLKINPLERK